MISFDTKKNNFFGDDDALYYKSESTSFLSTPDSFISFPFVEDESFICPFEEENKENLNESNFMENFYECKENLDEYEPNLMEKFCEYKKNLNESNFMENRCFNIEENNLSSYLNDRIEKFMEPIRIYLSNEDSFSFDIKNEDKQKDSNNSNQTKNSNLTQNNSKSSTKGSSEIGSNSIINPNKKEKRKRKHFQS